MNEQPRAIRVTPSGEIRTDEVPVPDLIRHIYTGGADSMLVEHDLRIKELERRGA